MSDLLVHWAVFDDCRRLCAWDSRVEPFFTRLLQEQELAARLGAISRGGTKFVADLLRNPGQNLDETQERRVAFALGGILHYAADKVMKPLMSEKAKADWHQDHRERQQGKEGKPSIREVSAYYDVHVFRKVYLEGAEGPFHRSFFSENETEPGRALEHFVEGLFLRTLLRSHTLSPNLEDSAAYVDRLMENVQPLYIQISLYSSVYAHPDPEKMAAYGVETDFYRHDDALVALARAVQNGHQPGADDLDRAMAQQPQGAYGKCLKLGMERMRDASSFWRGETGQGPNITQ